MGLSDGVAAATFQTAPDGRLLFCPWGRLGPCYVVPPERRELALLLIQAFFLLYFVTLLLALWRLEWGTVLKGVLPALFLLFHLGTWALCRRLETVPHQGESGIRAAERRIARAAGRRTLLSLALLCLALAGVSLWLLVAGRPLVGALGGVFFGLCALQLSLALRHA